MRYSNIHMYLLMIDLLKVNLSLSVSMVSNIIVPITEYYDNIKYQQDNT